MKTAAENANAFEWAGQPPKIAASHGESQPSSNTWFFGTMSQPPNDISVGSAIFVYDDDVMLPPV